MKRKEKLGEEGRGGSQSVETKEKERQGRRWLIYFGAAKIWIRVRAPCLKLPTYKLSFIPFPPHFLHRSTPLPLLDPPSRPFLSFSLFLSFSRDRIVYTDRPFVYSLVARTWSRRIEKGLITRDIYRIELLPTLLPLIIVSRRFIDAPRKRLLPESRLTHD